MATKLIIKTHLLSKYRGTLELSHARRVIMGEFTDRLKEVHSSGDIDLNVDRFLYVCRGVIVMESIQSGETDSLEHLKNECVKQLDDQRG